MTPYTMTRRTALAVMAATLAKAATRLPVNKNVKWGLGSNLWNYFPRVPFTDILDVMKDTGFTALRVTQFPQILQTYNITAAQMAQEATKRGCRIVTISFSPPSHDPARRAEVIANAKTAMGFRAGLHNHMGQMVQTPEEVNRCMAMTDPKLFSFSPDTAHLHLAGCDTVKTLEKHKDRLMLADYKDAKRLQAAKPDSFDRESIFDLGDGEIDFPGCHRVQSPSPSTDGSSWTWTSP